LTMVKVIISEIDNLLHEKMERVIYVILIIKCTVSSSRMNFMNFFLQMSITVFIIVHFFLPAVPVVRFHQSHDCRFESCVLLPLLMVPLLGP